MTVYDKIPYTRYVYQQTQPDHLATLATLFGLQPPPVEHCRVLELGCASGINTLAMALAIPQGEFWGVDLSIQQIAQGQEFVQYLDLKNITLLAMDMRSLSAELGTFDYIIAHGVYSWVSADLRDVLLGIYQRHLQPQGIGYLSYNVYPGWRLNQALREMLLYRTRQITNPDEKLQKSQELLNFFITLVKDKFDSYSLSLRGELEQIRQLSPNYLFHEFLEENNHPVFFHEFVEHLEHYGLQYIADAKMPRAAVEQFFPDLSVTIFEQEQYWDFLRNTPYRESLITHQTLPVERECLTPQFERYYLAAPLKPVSVRFLPEDPDFYQEGHLEQFSNAAGQTALSIGSPLLKAVCLCLGEVWPHSLSFPELKRQAEYLLSSTLENGHYQEAISVEQWAEVESVLLDLYFKKIIELHLYPPRFTTFVSRFPIASPLARLQCLQGDQITNLRCEIFTLDWASREILQHLEGRQDRSALQAILRQAIRDGKLAVYQGQEKATSLSESQIDEYLNQQVERILQQLAARAYLVS